MTITREQLDELEARAKAMRDSSTPFGLFEPDEIDRLVAIARAALAWSEARSAHRAACEQGNGHSTLIAFDDAINALYNLMHDKPQPRGTP